MIIIISIIIIIFHHHYYYSLLLFAQNKPMVRVIFDNYSCPSGNNKNKSSGISIIQSLDLSAIQHLCYDLGVYYSMLELKVATKGMLVWWWWSCMHDDDGHDGNDDDDDDGDDDDGNAEKVYYYHITWW